MSYLPKRMQTFLNSNITGLSRIQITFWSLFLFALLIPFFISVLSPLPFALFVPLIGVIFFISHKLVFGNWPWLTTPVPGLSQLIIVLLTLMFCSSFWSITPADSFERASKIAGLMLGSFALLGVAQSCPAPIWRKYAGLFPFAAMLVGGVTIIDIMTGLHFYNSINHLPPDVLRPDFLNKNTSVFVMSLPVILYLSWKSRSVIFFFTIFLIAAFTFFITYSQACQLAIIVMVFAAFGCLSFLEKITIRSAFLCLSFLLLMLPWIAPTLFDLLAAKLDSKEGIAASASASLRLENWDFLSRRILENPLNGFGIDTTRFTKFDTEQLYFHNDSIMHPHNIILQMWIEFGAFGAAWTLALFGYLYALFTKLNARNRRLAFLTFCGVMVFLLVSWSIWASWLIAVILYLSALLILAAKTSISPSNS